MKNFLLAVTVLLSLTSLAYSEDAVLGVDPALINSAMEGKDLVFRRKYDAALEHFAKIERDFPESATGLFGKMAVWQVRMFENEDFRFRKQYEQAEKIYDDLTLKQLRKGNVPAWELFVHGAADGMRGFFRGREDKWMGALSHGLHAMRMFRELKWREKDFLDVELGFGMYDFWRSVFTKDIKILPIFGDHRARGIALVENVAQNGRYSADLALANLMFIYGQENRYADSVSAADRLLAKYPENIIIKMQKAKNLYWAKKYDEALAIFKSVYSGTPEITKALFFQGIILLKKKEYDAAKEALLKFVSLDKQKEYLGNAYFLLGQIAEQEKNKEEAKASYEKSLTFSKTKTAEERLQKLGK